MIVIIFKFFDKFSYKFINLNASYGNIIFIYSLFFKNIDFKFFVN